MAYQINSAQELLKIIFRKDQIPVSNGVKVLKTIGKKDINSLTEELLFSQITNINNAKLS